MWVMRTWYLSESTQRAAAIIIINTVILIHGKMIETPYTDLILLLDAYQTSHTSASVTLKQALWNIHMARHVKGNVPTTGGEQQVYTALNIREELRAQVVVEPKVDPPSLIPTVDNEDETEVIKNDVDLISSNFILVRRCISTSSAHEKVPISPIQVEEDSDTLLQSTGLRQRKKNDESIQEEGNNKWTEEHNDLWNLEDEDEEMEKRLQNTDPLHLFGALPPRALRDAQKSAHDSLKKYVDAANIAREILDLLEKMSKE